MWPCNLERRDPSEAHRPLQVDDCFWCNHYQDRWRGNTQGGKYAVCFHHEDKVDGDVYILIVGRNTAGATLTFSKDSATVVEPEFKALPQDKDGTLIQLIEITSTT